jgi:hypothetical protein
MGEENLLNTEQDFSAAFDAVAAGNEPPTAETQTVETPSTETQTEETQTEETQTEETQTEETQTEETQTEETQAEETQAEETQAEETQTSAPSVEEVAEAAAKKVTDQQAKAAAEAQKVAEQQAEADAKAKKDQDALEAENLTAPEKEMLDKVIEDFPEVADALKVVERVTIAKMQNIFEKKIGDITAQFEQKLAPALATSQMVAGNQHQTEILSKHKDALDILPDVEKWVEKQPVILQGPYNEVLDNGSAEQVTQLLDLYKESIKPAQPAVDEVKKAAEAKAREEKLASQEGVKGRHSANQTTIDPGDFSGAFSKFAAQ